MNRVIINIIFNLILFGLGYAIHWTISRDSHLRDCISNYTTGWREGKKYAQDMNKVPNPLSIVETLELVETEICDSYCKFPTMTPPEGKDENWLTEDKDSPCNSCPLRRL